ncbi:MAG: thiamine pyrophosphate-binding protein [Haloplanus sp.]
MSDDESAAAEEEEGATPPSGADRLCAALVEAGVDLLVGLPGTQTLPLDRTVARRDDIEYVMARHETAIPHVAWGHYESGGGMAATLTVPGPGDTNAMHGLKNALEDCVPIVHVAAAVDPADRGKGAIHEIEPGTFDNVVKSNRTVESPSRLVEHVERALATACAPPTGPVRLGIPSGILDAPAPGGDVCVRPERTTFDIDDAVADAVDVLAAASRPVVYVGGGTRRSATGAESAHALAAELNAPVVTSYKGKGVVPDDDDRVLGVTGSHLPAGARRVLDRADAVLALGTDFDGVTTDDWTLPMGDRLVHVNVDPAAIGTAYAPSVGIVGDAGRVGERLLDGLRDCDRDRSDAWNGAAVGRRVRAEYRDRLDQLGVLDPDATPARTPAALEAIRAVCPPETVVVTGVGGFRLWAKQVFAALRPEAYVTAGSWAGMGVGVPAALGAKLANPETPVVALVGDGELLMCLQELHTAVEYDLDVVTVIFNNADYGIVSKSPALDESGFGWDSPDFATIAEGFGCRATDAETAREAADSVRAALDRAADPEVIDLRTDPKEPSVVEAAAYDSTVDLA